MEEDEDTNAINSAVVLVMRKNDENDVLAAAEAAEEDEDDEEEEKGGSAGGARVSLCEAAENRSVRVWATLLVLVFVVGIVAGSLFLVSVHNAVFLSVVLCVFGAVLAILAWNVSLRGRRIFFRAMSRFVDAEITSLKDGQFVKITGEVHCGDNHLESPYEKVPRCVYTSTSLYENRGWNAKANRQHWCCSWGLSYTERHFADFYISDSCSGLRVFVKVGEGSQVISHVDETTIIDIGQQKKDLSSYFLSWLRERNLPCHRRKMQLKEGYIREGNTISVLGVVQWSDGVPTIVPSVEPFLTGCLWKQLLLPVNIKGMVLLFKETVPSAASEG